MIKLVPVNNLPADIQAVLEFSVIAGPFACSASGPVSPIFPQGFKNWLGKQWQGPPSVYVGCTVLIVGWIEELTLSHDQVV